MTTMQLVNYVHAHSFPAWAEDEGTIHVVIPWVRRDDEGRLRTGHDVTRVSANLEDVKELILR